VIVEKYQPYILTVHELKILFNAIDSIKPNFESPDRTFIIPVLFRMMFCCGMHPPNPLHFKVEDINPDNRSMFFRQSKN